MPEKKSPKTRCKVEKMHAFMLQIPFGIDWANFAHIQAENLQNEQKCDFGKKLRESMG